MTNERKLWDEKRNENPQILSDNTSILRSVRVTNYFQLSWKIWHEIRAKTESKLKWDEMMSSRSFLATGFWKIPTSPYYCICRKLLIAFQRGQSQLNKREIRARLSPIAWGFHFKLHCCSVEFNSYWRVRYGTDSPIGIRGGRWGTWKIMYVIRGGR